MVAALEEEEEGILACSCHSRDESTPDTTNAHVSDICWSPSRRNIGLDDSISEKCMGSS